MKTRVPVVRRGAGNKREMKGLMEWPKRNDTDTRKRTKKIAESDHGVTV